MSEYEWEEIHRGYGSMPRVIRMAVPGGWIYQTFIWVDHTTKISTVFVPHSD